MTGKERWQAVLNGEKADRMMFWPKLYGKSYACGQEKPLSDMSNMELYRYMEADFMEYMKPSSSKLRFAGETRLDILPENRNLVFRAHTVLGDLKLGFGFDATTQSYHPVQYPIQQEQDFDIAIRFFEDMNFEPDAEGIEQQKRVLEQCGQDGICGEMIGESPLMAFIEYFAGVENGHYLLMDYPEQAQALFDSMQHMYQRRMKVICANSLADVLIFTENTSSTLISPAQFAEYCKPHLQKYAQWVQQCEKPLMIHMCGKLKAMLPELKELDAPVFEALTSAPVGDVTLEEVRQMCPRQKCLIGGGNAVMWTQPLQDIKKEVEQAIGTLSSRRGIVYSTGGVVPAQCSPDTLRETARFIHNL